MNKHFKTLPLFSIGWTNRLFPPQTCAIGRVNVTGQAAQIYFDSTAVLLLFEKAGIGESVLTLKKKKKTFTFSLLMFIYRKTVRLILPCTCQMSAYTLTRVARLLSIPLKSHPSVCMSMQAFLQSGPLQT